jgi:hypothetical protein
MNSVDNFMAIAKLRNKSIHLMLRKIFGFSIAHTKKA